ncbi:hypothetical protein BU52_13700 [Streptomyces toyocaensis]|uniref:Uncharacterized protein n=1 Tax=Streptomyces toyocaensis TaxID=55952 RepID=A0A081XSE8_STRTO|nr:hypothetical protein [Streptomyces toyocaensis]KES06471.1 hypothetical protein BU52_13700 [Streptomyces toyocaensis]
MSGRADSDPPPDTRADDVAGLDEERAGRAGDGEGEARRARWAAAGAGGVLALAGVAAALLRVTGSAPALVPAAYAGGAVVCGLAGVLGLRGRTRRALWLLVAGLLVMALGDHFD